MHRYVNSGKDSGRPPPVWVAIPEALALELTARPRKGESK